MTEADSIRPFLAKLAKDYHPDMAEHYAWALATRAAQETKDGSIGLDDWASKARSRLMAILSAEAREIPPFAVEEWDELRALLGGWTSKQVAFCLDDGKGKWDDREIRRWMAGEATPPPIVTQFLRNVLKLMRHAPRVAALGHQQRKNMNEFIFGRKDPPAQKPVSQKTEQAKDPVRELLGDGW